MSSEYAETVLDFCVRCDRDTLHVLLRMEHCAVISECTRCGGC